MAEAALRAGSFVTVTKTRDERLFTQAGAAE
jgi:hypothetical protein